MSTTTEVKKPRKRPTRADVNRYELPQWAKDDKKFAYRWVKESRFTMRSDGIDIRGWEKTRIPKGETGEGEYLRNGEHFLAKMAIEDYEDLVAYKQEQTRIQTEMVTGAQKELEDRTAHEFRNAGGKLKLNVSVE